MQSFGRAPCRASVERHAELWQSSTRGFCRALGKLRKESLAELRAELSSRAFSRALCRALVKVDAESWQSSVQSFEGALSLVKPLRALPKVFGKALCRARCRALVELSAKLVQSLC